VLGFSAWLAAIPVLVYEPCRAEPIVAADSGIPPGCLAHAVGPERLHSSLRLMSQPWKQIERRGVCHYPDVSSENIYIVSVDNFATIEQFLRCQNPGWTEKAEHYRGKTWFVVVFDELAETPHRFWWASSPPFATVAEAAQFAGEKIPTGIVWEDSQDET